MISRFPNGSPSSTSVPALYTTISGSNSSSAAGRSLSVCVWGGGGVGGEGVKGEGSRTMGKEKARG